MFDFQEIHHKVCCFDNVLQNSFESFNSVSLVIFLPFKCVRMREKFSIVIGLSVGIFGGRAKALSSVLVLRAIVIKRVEAPGRSKTSDLMTYERKSANRSNRHTSASRWRFRLTKGFNWNLPLLSAFDRRDRIYLERKYRREEKKLYD